MKNIILILIPVIFSVFVGYPAYAQSGPGPGPDQSPFATIFAQPQGNVPVRTYSPPTSNDLYTMHSRATEPTIRTPGDGAAALADVADDMASQAAQQEEQAQQIQLQSIQPTFKQRMGQANADANEASAECREKRLKGQLKTFVDSVNCSNPRIIDALRRADYPYMDLAKLDAAKRLELARQLDEKKLTENQEHAIYNKFLAHLEGIEKQRLAKDGY